MTYKEKFKHLKYKARCKGIPFELSLEEVEAAYSVVPKACQIYLIDTSIGYVFSNLIVDTKQAVGKYRTRKPKYGLVGIRYDKVRNAYKVFDKDNKYIGFTKQLDKAKEIAIKARKRK